ncbi:alpha/beta hydrolase family protein [Actinocorallia herbida]|uniref:Alpha/beta hydrolase family protein n=1 Tax=Actinocorallia herbida TaxID=58109 RepID=A0A3N1DA50_9ACTN|nr:alpha/beta hydrolase family protein [Actinocorallia herbida]
MGIDSTTSGPWDVKEGATWITRNIPEWAYDPAQGPDGKLVLSIGNPDSAENVAVYVPGTTSQLDGIGGDIDRAANLHRRSEKYGSGSVSTIIWLGYDAPDSIMKDAAVDKYADEGAPKFLAFLDGIDPGRRKHVTVIGHSYGSVVIGESAIRGRLHADEVIAAGSPGMHVGQAKDLDVGEHHVWVQAADGDPVPALGRLVHGAPAVRGVPTLPQVPSDGGFGGNLMSTDTQGHSDYWKSDSLSLDNQAKVIMGGHETQGVDDDPGLAKRPMFYR